jgi:hemerythrin-like domain-containing protein
MPGQPQPNIASSLMTVHAVITRGLRVSLENASRFKEEGYPDSGTRQGFANYIQALATSIEVHHTIEDLLAFPALQEPVPEAP